MGGMIETYLGSEASQPIASLPVEELIVISDNTVMNFYDTQRKRCQKFAETVLGSSANPVQTLTSAGETVVTDAVKATRLGFQDFEKMQLAVQWWKISGDTDYRDHAMQMILEWADLNIPTGHPINQTKFVGLHLALQDLAPNGTPGEFSSTDYNTRVKPWLELIRDATLAWSFAPEPGGGTLQYGNHYTHAYQQLLMCYRSLGDTSAFNDLLDEIDIHATFSFPFGNGSVTVPDDMPYEAEAPGQSIDFIRRDAFHYQNYNLQPWLNIAITEGTDRYESLVTNAFEWLWDKVLDNSDLHKEFTNSDDEFDDLRWEGSHSEYLQPETFWMLDEGMRVIMMYYQYRWSLGSSPTVNDGLIALAMRGDKISSEWPYWIRFTLGV